MENSLILSFKDLREVVCSKSGWESLTTLDILKPFFDVIKSEDTTGPMTGVALQSIEKFLKHPIICI